MVEDIQKREEATWEDLRRKVRERHQGTQKRAIAVLPVLLILLGVLSIGICGLGLYAKAHYAQPLALPESIELLPLTVADQYPLQASDFVQGLEGTDIQVSFDQNYDAQLLGAQEISLVFTRDHRTCTRTVQLYRFHLEPSVTVRLGEENNVDIRDFVPDESISASFVTELSVGKGGIFSLRLLCAEREYEVEYVITEDVPPQGVGKEVTVEAGAVPDPAEFVEQILDDTSVTVTYEGTPTFVQAGKQTLILVLTDLFGNTSQVEAVANIVPAANGPQFAGLETIYLELGATVSYKTGVTATDAQDGQLSFEVDPGNFDNKTAGRYTVLYSATDSDGNKLVMPRTVVVESHVGQIVREKAQELLNRIIKPGMTHDEKIYAVFKQVKNYVWYSGNSDKSSLENAAYEGFTKWAGDCYTYYAMVRVMLDMLQIPNVEVTRVGGTSHHWWNLVQFEDGKYYHVDATPHRYTSMEHFKMTESVIIAYTNTPKVANYRPNYYTYDKTLPEYQNIEIAQ